jgi:hypothetical protein
VLQAIAAWLQSIPYQWFERLNTSKATHFCLWLSVALWLTTVELLAEGTAAAALSLSPTAWADAAGAVTADAVLLPSRLRRLQRAKQLLLGVSRRSGTRIAIEISEADLMPAATDSTAGSTVASAGLAVDEARGFLILVARALAVALLV